MKSSLPFFFLLLISLFGKAFLKGQNGSLPTGANMGAGIFAGTETWFLQTNVASSPGVQLGSREFDVNGDQVSDLRFDMEVYGTEVDSMFVKVKTLNGAELRILSPSNYIDSLSPGELILASNVWTGSQINGDSVLPLLELYRNELPPIQDVTTTVRYLACRFPVNGTWNYAWIEYQAYGYAIHWGALNILSYAWKGTSPSVGNIAENEALPISIFPNPSTGTLYLNAEEPGLRDGKFRICDQMGRTVFQSSVGNGKLKLELGHLPAGTYHIQIHSEKGRVNRKWIRK